MTLFGTHSVEEITSLEDLNETLNIVSIKGWITLLFIIALGIASLIWAVSGTLPITVSGKCIALEGSGEKKLQILGFFPLFSGQKVHTGMQAKITLDTVNADHYGMLEGVVTEVLSYPVGAEDRTLAGIPSPSLREYLVRGEFPSILVIIEPKQNLATPSGFQWTSREGPPMKIPQASVGTAEITLQTIRPISYVIPSL